MNLNFAALTLTTEGVNEGNGRQDADICATHHFITAPPRNLTTIDKETIGDLLHHSLTDPSPVAVAPDSKACINLIMPSMKLTEEDFRFFMEIKQHNKPLD